MESFVSLHLLIGKELPEGLANASVGTKNFKKKEKDVIRQNQHALMTVLDSGRNIFPQGKI